MLSVSRREHRGLAIVGTLLLVVCGFWGCRMSQGASPAEPALAPKEAAAAEPVTIDARGDEPVPSTANAEEQAKPASTDTAGEKPAPLVVHVSGAVKRPGVYTLKSGDRIYHAIRVAGGFKPNAWQEALNLADQVQDADQIIVPTKEEMGPPVPVRPAPAGVIPATAAAAAPSVSAPTVPAAPAPKPRARGRVLGRSPVAAALPARPSAGVAAVAVAVPISAPASAGEKAAAKPGKFKNPGDGVVNINTASSEELQRLPGVGPAMAQRILDYRQQIGQFADASQLQDVKGIGAKTYAKMQPFVAVR